MWKWLQDTKAKMALVVGLVILLSQIPATRDTATRMVGLALGADQKRIEAKIDSTIEIMQQMVKFQNLIMQMVLPETLKAQGADSATIDSFMRLYRLQWDSLLKRMEGDSL